MSDYNVYIGLEIHAELDTKTKAFCSCRNSFGSLPNTQVCPVCLGLPGTLPTINKKAIEYTIMGGLSFGSEIQRKVVFERKNFFYPDMSKSYQITQLSHPLGLGGGIRLSNGKFIEFNRIHLEEDTGKLIHTDEETLVDFNRAGIPIIELVTNPQIMTAEEVVEFLTTLRKTLIYAGIARCKMEEGGLRFDLNISVQHRDSQVLGTRSEINNLGSLRSVEDAINYETRRQIELLESGQSVARETRVWNDELGESRPARIKETENDYRYFPDPDIRPIEITDKDIARLQARLPEIIDNRRKSLLDQGISEDYADTLLGRKDLLDYFTKVVDITAKPIEVANWIMVDLLKYTKNTVSSIEEIITVENFAEIIDRVSSGDITRANGKILLDECIKTGKEVSTLVVELDLMGEVNKKDVVDMVGMIINEKPGIIADFENNPDEVINHFIGEIMRHTQGKARPEYIEPLVIEILKSKDQ